MVSSIKQNKRGWIRILEATIAVMIVSGVLVVVYSKQVDHGIAPAEYFFSLQRQILADISSKSDLRLAILNTDDDILDGEGIPVDENFEVIYDFIDARVPDAFGFYLRVCDINQPCNIDDVTVVQNTRDKDVFVEEIIISAELGDGTNAIYSRGRKLRFFIWEKR